MTKNLPKNSRVVAWFSCGAASAVAAKMAIHKYKKRVEVVYCDTSKSEHPDNMRFLLEVQKWLGQEIKIIKSSKYSSIDEVIEDRQYLAGVKGAPCTVEMKKTPRFDFQHPDDIHVFGYTTEEGARIGKFEESNPELFLDWILYDNYICKDACFEVLAAARIAPPQIYSLGFANANCIGCVKATSPHYWREVRRHFPEIFAKRAEQSHRFGARLTRIKGKRIFIDEIPAEESGEWKAIRKIKENISCGPQCSTE